MCWTWRLWKEPSHPEDPEHWTSVFTGHNSLCQYKKPAAESFIQLCSGLSLCVRTSRFFKCVKWHCWYKPQCSCTCCSDQGSFMVVEYVKGPATVILYSKGAKSSWIQWRSGMCKSRMSTACFEKSNFCRGMHISQMFFITQGSVVQ